ncbi:MAG: hypothetical protein NTU95_07080 [Methanothrix sp.]|nr:hypothetical protein [Methanothrix sp.]
MRWRAVGLEAMLWIFILTTIFISSGLAFELSPANPAPGQEMKITGTAQPGEDLTFQSSFTMNLPVAGGEYGYETTILVPQKPNRFTVSANNVQDFNAGVKFGIWITKSFQASGGTARISQADVPPGRYNLKMFGKALPGSTQVPVNIEAQTQVQADSVGKYELVIDTSGIPAGDYRIQGAGDAKTIRLGGGGSAPASALAAGNEGADETLPKKQEKKPVEINRETVEWYAGQIGFEVKNASQYDEAEKLLKKRLSGGYWKIISKGEPLTEEAGDCLQKYCLVRGADACDVCREKDIILKGGQPSQQSSGSDTSLLAVSGNRSSSSSESGKPEQGKGLLSTVADWIGGLLGMLLVRL